LNALVIDTLTELFFVNLQVTVEFPYVFVQAVLFGTILYALIQFEWMAAKFLLFIFFLYFTLLIFTLWGMLTVALTPNLQVAAIISAAAFGIWNLFAGFLIPRPVCSLLQSSLLLKSSLKLLDQLTIRRNTCFVALSFQCWL
jgi:ABC-type multidrug transport system permease subunit